MKTPSDDSRLTAYALGELDAKERAVVEALLEKDPEARAEVEAIRATAETLRLELAHEPQPVLTEEQRKTIDSLKDYPSERRPDVRRRRISWGQLIIRPAAVLLVFGVLSFAIGVFVPRIILRAERDVRSRQQVSRLDQLAKAQSQTAPTSAESNAASTPLAQPKPKSELTPEPKPEPTPELKPEPKPEPTPEFKPEPKLEPKLEPKPEPKPEPPGEQEKVPLDIKLPKPMFAGTPPKIVSIGKTTDLPPSPAPASQDVYAKNDERSPEQQSQSAAPVNTATLTPEEAEPLDVRLPKPMFVGTPRNIVSPNLEKTTGEKRPVFMVPRGTVNISKDKPVTCSDTNPIIGEVAMVTDTDKEGADGSFVEIAPGLQWFQIDLKADFNIYAIVFWHYHSQARVYRDVIVQASDDPDFVTGVTTLFNNDHENTAGLGAGNDKEYIETNEGKLVDARGVRARYVRLYSNGNTSNDMNHMIEVEVFGKPAK